MKISHVRPYECLCETCIQDILADEKLYLINTLFYKINLSIPDKLQLMNFLLNDAKNKLLKDQIICLAKVFSLFSSEPSFLHKSKTLRKAMLNNYQRFYLEVNTKTTNDEKILTILCFTTITYCNQSSNKIKLFIINIFQKMNLILSI